MILGGGRRSQLIRSKSLGIRREILLKLKPARSVFS